MAAAITEKKTKRRSRAKTISIDKAMEQQSIAVEDALEKQRLELEAKKEQEEYEFTDEQDVNTSSLFGSVPSIDDDEESIRQANKEVVEFDLFDFIEKNYFTQGVPVTYRIKKDGALVGEMPHPSSWVALQKSYGGGYYRIQAIHSETKAYIKSGSQTVVAPATPPTSAPVPQTIVQPPTQDFNEITRGMMEMFQTMQTLNAKERLREQREEKSTSGESNNLLMTLMQTQQTSQQNMMMKIAEMNQKTAETQSNNFSKVIEKMDDKFTRMFEKLSDSTKNNKPELGLMEMLQLTQTSEDRGRETMSQILELSETLAESRGGASETKEGALGTIVKAMMPLLASAGKSAQAAQAAQANPGIQRRRLHPGQAQAPRGPQAVHSYQGQAIRTAPPQAPRAVQPPMQQSSANPFATAAFKEQAQVIPQPTDNNSGAVDGPLPDTDQGRPRLEEPSTAPYTELLEKGSEAQQFIAVTAIPTIAQHIENEQFTARDVAGMVSSDLSEQGYGPQVVVKEFSFDNLMEVAAIFELAEIKKKWFEEFYDALQDIAGSANEQGDDSLG